jgi:hypothetical protein
LAHLGPGITINHAKTRYEAGRKAKRVLGQKKIAPGDNPPERLLKVELKTTLANLGAQESAVVFDANLSATEKVSNRGNRFFAVLRAGTHGQDKVSEREFRAWLEDEGVFLHSVPALFDSISGASVQSGPPPTENRRLGGPEWIKKCPSGDRCVQLMNITLAHFETALSATW